MFKFSESMHGQHQADYSIKMLLAATVELSLLARVPQKKESGSDLTTCEGYQGLDRQSPSAGPVTILVAVPEVMSFNSAFTGAI